jgi:hypothetical protein
MCVGSFRTARSATQDEVFIRFNNVSSNYYLNQTLQGNGSTATSISNGGDSAFRHMYACADSSTANTFSNAEIYIPNYTSTSVRKSLHVTSVQENGANLAYCVAIAGTFNPFIVTTPINRISFFSGVGSNLKAGSSAYLYGITKA